jgi:hypothetical protein
MNTKAILALAAFAALAATGARADDADASQYAVQFTGSRARAEVQAEAARVAQTRSIEPAGSRVIAAPQSSREQREVVRAQAAEALRLGRISSGEIGPM